MNIEELVDIQKKNFLSLQSDYSKLINFLNHQQKLDDETLVKLIKLNYMFKQISSEIIDIKYSAGKKDKRKKTKENLEMIENFEKDQKSIKAFLPYIFYYRFMLN